MTFVLQKFRHKIEGFDDWYEPWRQRMTEDKVLRWLVAARNHIEKEGDLDTASTMRVSITDSYMPERSFEANVPPRLRSQEIAYYLASSDLRPKNVWPDSTLRVERRWVDSNLPDREIMAAIGHALGVYVELLVDAHGSLIPAPYEGPEVAALDKMQASDEARVTEIALDTNDIIMLSRHPIKRDPKLTELAGARYGTDGPKMGDAESLESFAQKTMETAKRIMIVDKMARHVCLAISRR
ncbi:MAG: hypothetical protein NVSMB64_17330 [Candidatus Velthaea sp.]